MDLSLRPTIQSDLQVFFQNQQDEEANHMAAFTSTDPNDRQAYMDKWIPLLTNNPLSFKTIMVDDRIAGSLFTYEMEGETQISYWINKADWGKGIASKALRLFLKTYSHRPLYGRIAFDNIASRMVLEKCGFKEIGKMEYFSNARNKAIEEVVFRLDA